MLVVRNFRLKSIFLLIAGLYFIVGCVPEKKIGSEFLSKRQNVTLVLIAPQWVKMKNLSDDSTDNKSELSLRAKDSVKFYSSKLLKDVNDSTLIWNYIKNLKQGLESQGYKTLIASRNDSIFPVKGEAFLVNIGQIELDEQTLPIRDETKYNNKIYAADYDLTNIELNFWLDICKIENGIAVEPTRLLYDSFKKTDDFSGYFYWNAAENRMDYSESIDEITPSYIHTIASQIGVDHAIRLNEYFLNEYIAYLLPGNANRMLFGVNPRFGTLYRIDEPPFQELKDR